MIQKITLCLLACCFVSCNSKAQKEKDTKETEGYAVEKTAQEWKAELSELEYYVLREAGTERAFTSPLDKNYKPGDYHCKACGVKLYESEHKFDSGTGWPSFDRGVDSNLEYDVDHKVGYSHTEIKCANCGSHLGHMFDDGPQDTTGKRHCINGVALEFKPENND